MPEYALGKLRGGYAVVWWEDGRRHRHALRTADPREAARRLDTFEQKKNELAPVVWTVGELWRDYRASLGTRPSATTMGWEWRRLKERFDSLHPQEVTEAVVQAHITARRAQTWNGKPITDGTIWTELGRLRMMFAWAVKKGHLTKAPYIERPTPGPARSLYLTRDQMRKFLAHCGTPHVALFATLAWTTGARAAAILDLTWDRVDFDRGRIRLKEGEIDPDRPMKGRAIIPMNGTARSALIEAKRFARTAFVIEWGGEKVASVKKAIHRAAVASGMPWVSPHVFRHSAAVMMAENRIPMTEIAQFLGHTNTKMTEKIYAKYSPEYLANAADALELPVTLKVVR